jgi:hypothetical protein
MTSVEKRHKYISLSGQYSWRVKVAVYKECFTEYFCFANYGGMDKALDAALMWRDAFLKQHGLLDRLKYEKSPDYFTSNVKPIIGVFISRNNTGINWTARYMINSQEYRKHFSINKYGNENAFQKACKIRYEQCGKLRVTDQSLVPCLPKVPYTIL